LPLEDKRVVVKGMPKGSMEQVITGAGVNVVAWASQYVVEQECQSRIDAKAFTGRGKLLELRQYLAHLKDVEKQMNELVETSKGVPGYWMYLTLHTQKNGLKFLRWRERGGAKRHLSWDEAAETWKEQGGAVQDWYRSVSNRCNQLNEMQKDLRRAITMARSVVQRSGMPIYAKAIPERVGKTGEGL